MTTFGHYKALVDCPSTDEFMDSVFKETGYRCDGGAGQNLKKDPSDRYDMVKDFGGFSEKQRSQMRPDHFYECKYARDGRAHGCASYDVMHCLHLRPRHEIPSMTIVSKRSSGTKIEVGGKDYIMPVQVPLFGDTEKATFRMANRDNWPNHMIIRNNKAHVDEELRAAVYASANCPVYREIGGNWKINHAQVTAVYMEESGWIIDAHWDGQPSGKTLDGISVNGSDYDITAELGEATLEYTARKAAMLIETSNISDDCEVISCKAVSENSNVAIDTVGGHAGRMLEILARGNTPHCRVRDENEITHVVPANRRFIITTMNSRFKTNKNDISCPPPTVDDIEQMYGHNQKGTAYTGSSTPPNILSIIEGLKVPGILNPRNFMLLIACLVVFYLKFTQIGIILGMAIALVAVSQGAQAMDLGTERTVDIALSALAVTSHYHSAQPLHLMAGFMAMISMRSKNDTKRGIMSIVAFWVLASVKTNMHPILASIVTALLIKWASTKHASMTLASLIEAAKDSVEELTVQVEPIIEPTRLKMHSVLSLPSRMVVASADLPEAVETELGSTRRVKKKNALVAAPFHRLPRERGMLHRRRKGVKCTRGFLFYEDEYDLIRDYLYQLDESGLMTLYHQSVRIHGRLPGDFTSVYSAMRNSRIRESIRAAMLKERW